MCQKPKQGYFNFYNSTVPVGNMIIDTDEFNERLEDLVGPDNASSIIEGSRQTSYGDSIALGVEVDTPDYNCLVYRNLIDHILTHYEIRGE